jgi:glycosyltransferase involved in cell wall biosynthesis
MKIGIDLTSFHKEHDGGKEQVLYNLLQGFQALGAGGKICIFCYDYSQKKVASLIPHAEIILVQPANLKKKLFSDLWVKTFRLPRLIKKAKIDLLFYPVSVTGLRQLSIPTVVLPHDIQPIARREAYTWFDHMRYRLIYHFDFSLRDCIISISDFDQAQMTAHYPQYAEKIERIYNPIAVIPPKEKAPLANRILAINIRYGHKNIETLIRAFARIKDQVPHDLTLVGRIDERTAHLKDLADALGLDGRVGFTGFISEAELNHLLSTSALYVNPSLFEGFGMTAVEAMIRKTPVLVANVTASPETTMGRAFYYQPARSEAALADKMLAILNEPPSQLELDAISQTIYKAYRVETIARKYLDLFDALVHIKNEEQP